MEALAYTRLLQAANTQLTPLATLAQAEPPDPAAVAAAVEEEMAGLLPTQPLYPTYPQDTALTQEQPQTFRSLPPPPGLPFATTPWDLSDMPMDGTLPPDASFDELDQFFQKVWRMKQDALDSLAEEYRQHPPQDQNQKDQQQPGQQDQQQSGPLNVRGHSFYDGDKLVGVSHIRISEINNYAHRTYQDFIGDYPEEDWQLDDAHVGKYYRVNVTWTNGYEQARDVYMDSPSQSVDIYRY